MEVGSKQEPCRVAVYVGAIPNGLQWEIVFNLKFRVYERFTYMLRCVG